MKRSRHKAIIDIILKSNVETQEELADKLRESGFAVTQATVSRDIRELSLIKILGEDGRQHYATVNGIKETEGISKVIKDAIKSVDNAGNLLVIKTLSGMGMAVAVNIDDMELPNILGTIAGDDVVFCAIKKSEAAEELKSMFLNKE